MKKDIEKHKQSLADMASANDLSIQDELSLHKNNELVKTSLGKAEKKLSEAEKALNKYIATK